MRFTSGVRALVAEPSPSQRELLESLLTRMNVCVDFVADGSAAVVALGVGDFDIIFIGMNLPGMDGPGTARAIRHASSGGEVPIIALGASTEIADLEACMAAGMNDYLRKPASLQALQEVLLRHLPAGSSRSGIGPTEVGASLPDDSDRVHHDLSGSAPAGRSDSVTPTVAMIDGDHLDQLGEDLGGDFVRESLQLFLDQLSNRVEAIADIDVDRDDADAVRRTVHSLGSPAAMLGLVPLSEASKAAERASTARDRGDAIDVMLDVAATTRLELLEFLNGDVSPHGD